MVYCIVNPYGEVVIPVTRLNTAYTYNMEKFEQEYTYVV